jgi:hypothetical protein
MLIQSLTDIRTHLLQNLKTKTKNSKKIHEPERIGSKQGKKTM